MTKKLLAGLGIIGFLATAGTAFAQTATSTTAVMTTMTTPSITTSEPEPIVLDVGAGGKVLLRGTIDSVSSGSITVKSWGGDWTVTIPSSAALLPQGSSVSSFQTGDFVGVQGSIDQSANWTVDASLVRDWTVRATIKTNVEAMGQAKSSAPTTIQGTLSNLDATGEAFTLTTSSGTTYSVSLTSGAILLTKNRATLKFSQVTNGDTVRTYGTVASSTITASIFRDVSVN
jgi:hypothetical protein